MRLARRTRGELRAARQHERGHGRLLARLRLARHVRDLDESQLDLLDAQIARRRLVETPQRLRGARRLVAPAGDGEALAAAGDRDVERGLDLAQVRVERAAERREPGVVHGPERDLLGRPFAARRQRRGSKVMPRVASAP